MSTQSEYKCKQESQLWTVLAGKSHQSERSFHPSDRAFYGLWRKHSE